MQTNFTEKGYQFEWIDVFNVSEMDLKSLAVKYKLPQAAVTDCLQPEHLPKFEVFDDYNFIIIRYYDPGCKADAANFQELSRKIAIFFNKNFLLTIHRSQAPVIEHVGNKYANDLNVKSPFDIVCKLIKNVLETYDKPLLIIDKEIDFYESKVFLKKKVPNILKNLYIIKRRTYLIKRLNVLSKSIVDSLQQTQKKNSFYQDMRDYYIHIEIFTDAMHDSIASLLNLYISLSSQKTNEVMRVLTVFSAFFLPLTFIVGIYGMNFQFMPELNMKYGYPAIMLSMAVVTFIIFQWFKRKGWL
ncbi:MAG: magnesium transporter CorA [Bacteroidia bacterium]|nr:magnesium transporter CorA [Bacteroidia bacterium]